jgi:hypothetical protein
MEIYIAGSGTAEKGETGGGGGWMEDAPVDRD